MYLVGKTRRESEGTSCVNILIWKNGVRVAAVQLVLRHAQKGALPCRQMVKDFYIP